MGELGVHQMDSIMMPVELAWLSQMRQLMTTVATLQQMPTTVAEVADKVLRSTKDACDMPSPITHDKTKGAQTLGGVQSSALTSSTSPAKCPPWCGSLVHCSQVHRAQHAADDLDSRYHTASTRLLIHAATAGE